MLIYRVGFEMELFFSISSSLLNMICKLVDGKTKAFKLHRTLAIVTRRNVSV